MAATLVLSSHGVEEAFNVGAALFEQRGEDGVSFRPKNRRVSDANGVRFDESVLDLLAVASRGLSVLSGDHFDAASTLAAGLGVRRQPKSAITC